ncbi:MAG: hypothetical protein ACLRLU_03325 [Haemophilus parainfluenzae]
MQWYRYSLVLIPFEQGDVFRRLALLDKLIAVGESQSLSSRAMSFDGKH